MASQRLSMTAYFDDGRAEFIQADQRDFVIFERVEKMGTPAGLDTMPIVFYRCVAYYALKRTGRIDATVTRDAFEAMVHTVEPEIEAEAVDPTQPEAIADSLSSSPSRRGKPSGKSSNGTQQI